MKTFKQVDFWISTGLIFICTIVVLSTFSGLYLVKSYFIIGGWQLISMFVHFLSHWFMKKGGHRSFYHWITLTIVIIALLGFLFPPLLFIFWLLLFVAPVMAMYYALLCYLELKELKLRHALNLK